MKVRYRNIVLVVILALVTCLVGALVYNARNSGSPVSSTPIATFDNGTTGRLQHDDASAGDGAVVVPSAVKPAPGRCPTAQELTNLAKTNLGPDYSASDPVICEADWFYQKAVDASGVSDPTRIAGHWDGAQWIVDVRFGTGKADPMVCNRVPPYGDIWKNIC